jgi:unsaturated rhamnogalacturonyl hydrolase
MTLWKEFALRYAHIPPANWTWHYEWGVVLKAFLDAWRWTGEYQWLGTAEQVADAMILADGTIRNYRREDYNLDMINPGKALFDVYMASGQIKFRRAIERLMRQVADQPQTRSGGWWHKQIYPWQMWLDGIYMATPFVVRYAREFGHPSWFDVVWRQIALVSQHTRDPETGLWVHAWDASRQEAWADPETGRSPHVWGRAMGWFIMALADVLEWWPPMHPAYRPLTALFQEVADAVLKVQDQDIGLWHQILTHPHYPGNYYECSCSAMFVYACAKGVRLGHLHPRFLAAARFGYQGLASFLVRRDADATVHLTHCNRVAGLGGQPYRDGSLTYYLSEPVVDDDPKAVAAFILASLELAGLDGAAPTTQDSPRRECL